MRGGIVQACTEAAPYRMALTIAQAYCPLLLLLYHQAAADCRALLEEEHSRGCNAHVINPNL